MKRNLISEIIQAQKEKKKSMKTLVIRESVFIVNFIILLKIYFLFNLIFKFKNK